MTLFAVNLIDAHDANRFDPIFWLRVVDTISSITMLEYIVLTEQGHRALHRYIWWHPTEIRMGIWHSREYWIVCHYTSYHIQ